MKTIKKISYLGPEGTFTEEALLVYLDKLRKKHAHSAEIEDIEKVPFAMIPDVIKSVDRGEAQEGIVPIENSNEGAVPLTLDVLTFESEAKIISEITIPIKHHLSSSRNCPVQGLSQFQFS
jgi:prephenate dehydratase